MMGLTQAARRRTLRRLLLAVGLGAGATAAALALSSPAAATAPVRLPRLRP